MQTLDYGTVAALLAMFGFAISASGWYFARKTDSDSKAQSEGVIKNELGHIANDIKDIKADFRSFREELNDTKSLAYKALAKAEAAHDRLDALGAPMVNKDHK